MRSGLGSWFRWQPENSAAYLYTVGSGFAGVLAAVCAQALHGKVPGYELAAVRFCHLCTLVIPRAALRGTDLRIDYALVPWVTLITAFTVLWNIFFYIATTDIPLGTLMTSYTSLTYLEIVLLARLFLGQKFVWGHLSLALFALAGNVLLVQPSPPFQRPTYACNVTIYDGFSRRPPLALLDYTPMLIATGLASSGAIIYKCKLGAVPLDVTSVWIAVCGLFTTTGLTMYLIHPVFVNGLHTLLLLVGHGTSAAVNTVLLQHAQGQLSPDAIFGVDVIGKCLPGFAFQYGLYELTGGFMNPWEVGGAVFAMFGVLLCVVGAAMSKYVWFKFENESEDKKALLDRDDFN